MALSGVVLAVSLTSCASEPLTKEDRAIRAERLESLERKTETNNRERRQRVDEPG